MNPSAMVRKAAKRYRRFVNRNKDPRVPFLRQMPKRTVCAEIGVWKGEFSEQILRITSPKLLHLIDPWEFQSEFSDRMYGGAVAKNQRDMDLIYEKVKQRLGSRRNVLVNRGKSEDVLTALPDDYFDWVYVDGNHSYDYVLNDLEACLRKVKTGGKITGDDYNWGKKYGFPVQQAVQDFLKEKGLENRLRVFDRQFVIDL